MKRLEKMKRTILIFAIIGLICLTSCKPDEVTPDDHFVETTTPPVQPPFDEPSGPSDPTLIARSLKITVIGGFRVGDKIEINGFEFNVTHADEISVHGFANTKLILARLHAWEIPGLVTPQNNTDGTTKRGDIFTATRNTNAVRITLGPRP